MRWIGTFFVTVLLGLSAAGAAAAPLSEEEALLQKGADLREAGDEVHAVLELQKAYDLNRAPKAAAQLGLSEWALGRWAEAEAHVTEALRATSDPYLRDRQRRQVLEQALRTIRTHLGSVEISGEPEGAEVIVAGRVVGKLPLIGPVRVATGQVDVEVAADGYEPATRTVQIAAGQYQRVLMRLERKAAEPVAVAPTAADAPPAPLSLPPAPQDTGVNWHRVAKWSALGGAVGMLGLGVAENIVQVGRADKVEDCDVVGCSNRDELERDRSRAKTLSVVGYVGAGVLTATWLVLLLTEPASSTSTAWACVPNAPAPGVSCAMRF